MAIFCAFRCDCHAGNSGSCLEKGLDKIYRDRELVIMITEKKGAVALSISAQLLFLCKKITARPRKNPAVGVKLSYATN